MNNLKSHKTVDQIAKKHRVNVSDIQKQLEVGQPIENEHTKNQELAKDIALQHLDEFPDYYTRLKKMEASAKKEHKKFKDVKESIEEKRFCPLCDKKETRSECSYGEKAWDKVSIKDEEYSMARSELENIVKSANKLKNIVGKGEGNLEAWVQSKITKASDYIDSAADYLESGEHKFSESKEPKLVDKIISEIKKQDPCWSGYTQVGMKNKNGKKVPNCVPVKKGVKKAKGYTQESTTVVGEAADNSYLEANPPKRQANIDEATRLPAQTGNILSVLLTWRGKTYTIRMFFPQVKIPTRKEVAYEIQKIYPGSVILQHKISNEQSQEPLIQISNNKSKNYLLNNKSISEEVEILELKK